MALHYAVDFKCLASINLGPSAFMLLACPNNNVTFEESLKLTEDLRELDMRLRVMSRFAKEKHTVFHPGGIDQGL